MVATLLVCQCQQCPIMFLRDWRPSQLLSKCLLKPPPTTESQPAHLHLLTLEMLPVSLPFMCNVVKLLMYIQLSTVYHLEGLICCHLSFYTVRSSAYVQLSHTTRCCVKCILNQFALLHGGIHWDELERVPH